MEPRTLLAGDLIAHWQAETLMAQLADGATVSTWQDSVNSLPATSRGAPMLSQHGLGGRPAIRFTAADGADSLRVATNQNPLRGAADFSFTIAFAASGLGLQGNQGPWYQNTGLVDANKLGFGADWGLSLNGVGQASAGMGRGIGQPADTVYSSSRLDDGVPHVVTVTRQAGTLTIYVDEQPANGISTASTAARDADMGVAFGELLTGGGGLTGDIGEIRFFNGQLSAAEVGALHGQLLSHYRDAIPVAVDDTYTLSEDPATLFFSVPASSGVLTNDFDPEGVPLTATLVTPPQHGTLSLNANGGFVYDPAPNFFGEDTFTYTANDFRPSLPATVRLIVQNSYDPASAVGDAYKLLAGQASEVSAAEGVLQNDLNPDRAALRAVLQDGANHGSVTLNADGSFRYDPQGFAGIATFTYRVDDGTRLSPAVPVQIVVNTPPVAVDDRYVVQEDVPLERDAAAGVAHNDLDAEGNSVMVSVIDSVQHGELTWNADGSFRYVPDDNFFGTDRFTYTISDGFDDAPQAATVTFEVTAVNDPPRTQPDQVSVFLNQVRDVGTANGVLANDQDIDSPGLTARIVRPATHATVTLAPDGSYSVRPATGFLGVDQFQYVANDGSADSAPTTVLINVLPLEQQIVINEIHYDPPDNTIREEFVELYNQGAAAVDLSQWYFSSGISFQFPANAILQPGQYAVVAQDPATLRDRHRVAESYGPWTGRLSSDGELLELRNRDGQEVDRVDYRQGFPWPIGAGGDGPSMELIHPALDNDLGGSWRTAAAPTPGAANTVYALNAPPQIRQVVHEPQQPKAGEATVIRAKVTDPNGVARVEVSYQVVLPGAFLPALLPVTPTRDLWRAVPPTRQPNPAYEDPANWTTLTMRDDGQAPDTVARDGIFAATIPGQAHRTLMRYRITAVDTLESSVQVPYADDQSRNFAYFVYDGVPDYNGTAADVLESLPVYHVIARNDDIKAVMAYSTRDQIPQGTLARFEYNWPAAFVYEGEVYDNISFRLRGANGRYYLTGKRSMRFRFNDGNYLQAYQQNGEPFPYEWKTLTTGKGFDNRLTQTFALNEAVNMAMYQAIGLPAADTLYAHLRVIDDAQEAPDQWNGDFWGMTFVTETYDVRFLDSHDLPRGNLYKLINQTTDPLQQQRYQAPDATTGGADMINIEQNLTGASTPEFIEAHVNLEKYYLFHALAEAIRHYDYWPSANKNMVYYFEPDYRPENSNLGRLWILPWDTDATWGPTWNNGHDVVYNALFPSGDTGGDSRSNPVFWPEYFNVVREIRDLLWQPDQVGPLIDDIAAVIAPFEKADADRWKGAPATVGNYNGLTGPGTTSLAAFVQDMKNFAFTGGNWPGGSVGAGGRARFLDTLQGSRGEAEQLPETPTIQYTGAANFAADQLQFTTSPFQDPQGNETFAAIEWRIAEVTDSTAPGHDPQAPFKLEYLADWESGELTEFSSTLAPPTSAVQPGHAYRARVRMKDATGRWSHWSSPVQFIATAAAGTELVDSIRISEVHYHPADPSATEIAAGFADGDEFEFLELTNISDQTVMLRGLQLIETTVNGQSQGVQFNFADSAIPQLAPGASVLVVENLAAFQFRYGNDLPVAGQWGGGLSNASEQLTLFGDGFQVQQFTYSDSWHRSTDGAGPSLEATNLRATDLGRWSQAEGWRASVRNGGSPGRTGGQPGDSNHDGRFDSRDLVAVFQAGKYEDDVPDNASFEEGDWNGDGDFNSGDLVFAFQFAQYLAEAGRAASQAVDSLFATDEPAWTPADGDENFPYTEPEGALHDERKG